MNIRQSDALEYLRALPDSSVGLILTDPPYFRVKAHEWDRQWSDAQRFIAWLDSIAEQWARVLKPNGTLVCFAGSNAPAAPGATLAAKVEVMLANRLNVIASAVWVKDAGWHMKASKGAIRSHFPQTERAIICEHYGADAQAKGEAGYQAKCDELRGFVFEPLRAYLDGERRRAGVDKIAVNVACGFSASPGGMASRHYFSRSQWWLPTAEHYTAMQALCGPGFLVRSYEDLRAEYEDLRAEYEDLRRPFNGDVGAHHSDVWTYAAVPAGGDDRHPCEKPEAMALDLVRQCSRRGDVVLDTFAGSGVFLSAAKALGRIPWGCDMQAKWVERTVARVGSVLPIADESPQVTKIAELDENQLDLFA